MEIQQYQTIKITHSPRGRRLSQPILVQLPTIQSKGEQALYSYIINAFSCKMSALIEFTLLNDSVTKVAEHLQRHATASTATLYQYVYGIHKFCSWLGKTPDQLMAECKDLDGVPKTKVLVAHAQLIDDFVGECQAEKLAPGTISNHVKGVKCLYQVNGLQLSLPYRLPRPVMFKDRAPTPEELSRLMEIAKLREKVIISLLALGGFRVGTLCQLQYRHVRKDLEQGIVPVHIHVEAAITKGKYGDYDTFIGAEAAEYLRLYLDQRRRGNPLEKITAETITDNSPLIRNIQSDKVTPLTPARIDGIIHSLYTKAGLVGETSQRRYELRAHSIRKYFHTQLAALGVNTDYIEYMMGHKVSTYNDVQMKGIEFLRGIYTASGLSIKPKTRTGKIDALKEIIRAWGINPEEILTREALTRTDSTYLNLEDRDSQVEALRSALRDLVRKELLDAAKGP